jgi:hypothetical protein
MTFVIFRRETSSRDEGGRCRGFSYRSTGYRMPSGVAIDDITFHSILSQAHELHARITQFAISGPGIERAVRERLQSKTQWLELSPAQEKLVVEILELLQDPRLSSWQAHELQSAFFGD